MKNVLSQFANTVLMSILAITTYSAGLFCVIMIPYSLLHSIIGF